MWLLIFLALTFALLISPLLPGILELKNPTDNAPLRVVQKFDINIKHFAQGLIAYLEKNTPEFLAGSSSYKDNAREGRFTDGTICLYVGKEGTPKLSKKEIAQASTSKLLLSAHPLSLPANVLFEAEIYSKSSIQMGKNSKARAMLAEGSIKVAESCSVLRWIHSNKSLHVANDFSLFGRASADEEIVVSGQGVFERMAANTITFGQKEKCLIPEVFSQRSVVLRDIAQVKDEFEGRWLIEGELDIPAGSLFEGNLVATKSITIGAGSHIIGSIKSNNDLVIETGVRVDGSVFCTGTITIEEGCHITGHVVSEKKTSIGTNSIIGSPSSPSTINGPVIEVTGNLVVHGTIWANDRGMVWSAAGHASA